MKDDPRIANNPAGRVHEILERLRRQELNIAALNGWRSAFDERPPQERDPILPDVDVLWRASLFMGEVASIRPRVQTIIDAGTRVSAPALRSLHQVESVAERVPRMESQLHIILDGLTDTGMVSLELCSDVIGDHDPDTVAIRAGELQTLLDACIDLRNAVAHSDEFTDDQRLVVVEHLVAVQHAMQEAHIAGAEPIRREVDGLAGALVTASGLREMVGRSRVAMRIVAFTLAVGMALHAAVDVKALMASSPEAPYTYVLNQTNVDVTDVEGIVGQIVQPPPPAIESPQDDDEP